MQSIPPEKLFYDIIREKVDHLEIQILNLLKLISFDEYPLIKSTAEKWMKDGEFLHKKLNGIQKKLIGMQEKITSLNLDDAGVSLNMMNHSLGEVYDVLKPKTRINKVVKRGNIPRRKSA